MHKKKPLEISMQSLITTIITVFRRCSVYSRAGKETWPTKEMILDCIRQSGFDIYG